MDVDPMKGKHAKTEERVKPLLDAVFLIDGGWDAMLDILHRRSIQKTLRDVRIQQNITQAELAERMDISQSQLSELETVRYPDYRLTTLGRWAHALDMKWDWQLFLKSPVDDEDCEGS